MLSLVKFTEKTVGRIGRLTNDGILFCYIDVSNWAVLTPVSASYWHLVGNIYECEEDRGSCTLTKKKVCPLKITADGTFVEDIWDGTESSTTCSTVLDRRENKSPPTNNSSSRYLPIGHLKSAM
ncbi:hypothetical protein CAEBREN_21078 [Caenorhabditis brenneri]|uniref:Uncharacterized protein n=1 Tax=Caenorhabditis brenneri TaxID=135651 RepID=G0P027_CAEBE|nr:hypothetical protein CAEBREN_21078 [Caenorhabditis brenneri]